MGSPKLIPEQRPDKNGNVVTRWVRSMFAGNNSQARSIPKATIDVSPHPPAKREAKEIYNRLMAAMPEGDTVEILAGAVGEEGARLHAKLDDRATLEHRFEQRDYAVLPLFEKFDGIHRYSNLVHAADICRRKGFNVDDLTSDQISSYVTVRETLRSAIQGESANGVSNFLPVLDLPEHALMHPEDAPVLEKLLQQGVVDRQQINETLEEINTGNLSRAISDGFL